jgi:hypothetical protein
MQRMTILLAAAGLTACGTAADPDPGLSATIRVAGAQFVPGSPPGSSDVGPRVRTVAADNNRVFPGLRSSSLSGSMDLAARSVLVDWPGDDGYWIIPGGVADPLEPTLRIFGANLSFSRSTPAGKHAIELRAIDQAGKVGPTSTFAYAVAEATLPGALVVSLSWDNDSDLDLHLVMPNPDPTAAAMTPTVEIWPKHPSSVRPGASADVVKRAANLDFDSNGQCAIDGRRQEDVTIAEAPPAGHYTVRVDTFALCGQSSSRWKVTIYRDGMARAEASGVATPYDGYPAQGAGLKFGQDLRPGTEGAGQTAVEFDL